MDKVVYILGAGFSAPLGLPVMSNFRLKSQDMYWRDPERYSHFESVFQALERMAQSKNFYSTDLYNIEEILSILEMGSYVHGSALEDSFLRYIRDVILFFTPPFQPYKGFLPGNWDAAVFGSTDAGNKWRNYTSFVGSLLNLCFSIEKRDISREHLLNEDIAISACRNPSAIYSVVTLNYDLILETVANFFSQEMRLKNQMQFIRERAQFVSEPSSEIHTVPLAKLHGSIDTENIVPPTWNKRVTPSIISAWTLAFEELATAKHIRVLGYSLPTADAYVKYLLKAASVDNPYLKSIDIICRDRDGSVRRRYEEFINFNYFRFVNASIEDYLSNLVGESSKSLMSPSTAAEIKTGTPWVRCLDSLEISHDKFMGIHKVN